LPSERLILPVKLIVLATWFAGAASFLLPPETTLGSAGRALFWMLLVVHSLECVFFYKTLRQTDRPLGFEILQALFYGAIHYGEVKTLLASREAEGHPTEAPDPSP
jgi:hypothetical protein